MAGSSGADAILRESGANALVKFIPSTPRSKAHPNPVHIQGPLYKLVYKHTDTREATGGGTGGLPQGDGDGAVRAVERRLHDKVLLVLERADHLVVHLDGQA